MHRDGERHTGYGAEFETRGGRTVVAHYGRPERTHLAVRNGVGVIEMGYGVVVVEGSDAVDFVDNAVSNRVPVADGSATPPRSSPSSASTVPPRRRRWRRCSPARASRRTP